MPWTRKQVKYLESSGSPLTSAQKAKMNQELHDNPAMGHMKKGEFHGTAANYKHSRPKRKVMKRTF